MGLFQQKLDKREGGQIDRNRDIEHFWEFYQRFKRHHKVDDMQREEERWRESGTFSTNIAEYDPMTIIAVAWKLFSLHGLSHTLHYLCDFLPMFLLLKDSPDIEISCDHLVGSPDI